MERNIHTACIAICSLLFASILIPTANAQGPDGTDFGAVAGTGYELVPQGVDGEVSVVMWAPLVRAENTSYPIILRNNSNEHISNIDVSAAIRRETGDVLGVGTQLFAYPKVVAPGGMALVQLIFPSISVTDDARITFSISSDPLHQVRFRFNRDLDVLATSFLGDSIVGEVTNSYDEPIDDPIIVVAVCFDANGELASYETGSVSASRILPGQDAAFQITLYFFGDRSRDDCARHLVAASGSI